MLSHSASWTVKVNDPCYRLACPPNWGRSRENSLRLADMELWLVRKGHGWMKTRTQTFTLLPGFCALMRPGGIYDAGQDETRPLGITFVHFDVLNLQKGVPVRQPVSDLSAWPEFYQLGDVDYLDAVTRRIVHLSNKRSPVANDLLKGVLLDILERPALLDGPPTAHSLHAAGISAMVAEIQSSSGTPPDVAEMARRSGLSQAHFSRIFHKITGQSPRDFLQQTRLMQARQLLTGTELSIGEISERLGYADIFFFSRQFKNKVGIPPSAYRKQAIS